MLTLAQLQAICPQSPAATLALFVEPLNAMFAEFGVTDSAEQQRFLAQCAHESAGFTRLVENLNYNPAGILATFNTPKRQRFTKDQADALGRTGAHSADQMSIANIAYANRMGNGDAASGDGWRFRGKGILQITGRDNHRLCGETLHLDLISHPEILLEPEPACRAAGWFFESNGLWDLEDFEQLTRHVNGGVNGLADRYAYLGRAKEALA